MPAGAKGWDQYAPFYDWENARTMGRRDVGYWTRLIGRRRGRVLELGCGTGRLLLPLARAARHVCGIDLSAQMLARASARAARRPRGARPSIVRGDMRHLPFDNRTFSTVIAPYGVLQSLTDDGDLSAALAEAARVLKPGGLFAIDLVPDLTSWQAYQKQVRFRGLLSGKPLVLVESVRQNRRRGLTMFDEEFRVGRGRQISRHRFTLTFRTVPMEQILARISSAGLTIQTVAGSYRGAAWHPDAAVWLIEAKKT